MIASPVTRMLTVAVGDQHRAKVMLDATTHLEYRSTASPYLPWLNSLLACSLTSSASFAASFGWLCADALTGANCRGPNRLVRVALISCSSLTALTADCLPGSDLVQHRCSADSIIQPCAAVLSCFEARCCHEVNVRCLWMRTCMKLVALASQLLKHAMLEAGPR